MKLKLITGIMLTLFLASILTLAFNIQPVKAEPGTIHIRANGSIDPSTANITSTDNVTYTFTDNNYDEIVVERDNIVVDGAGYTVQGKGSGGGMNLGGSNVTIKNIKIKAFNYGIVLFNSSYNSISGNNIKANTYYGIVLSYYSSNNTISGNNITANNYDGIMFNYFSNNNTISGNNIKANKYEGISLWSSSSNSISGNNITNNVDGILLTHNSSYNSIYGNNITNNRFGIDLSWSSNNNTISGNNIKANNNSGIALGYSSSNSISGNNITNNPFGMQLYNSANNNTISRNNIIANSQEGIYLRSSSNNTISGNNIKANKYEGIYLYNSSNSISGNTIANNSYGIWLRNSSDNFVYHNNFINNTNQAYIWPSGYANFWDDGYPSGGNYWSDYNGMDTDQDAIGDTPYVINKNNTDNYPLMGMFSNFTISWQEEPYYLTTICNSTISNFHFNASQKIITFNVTGPDYTLGFCRITIPNLIIQELWKGNYTVLVDGKEVMLKNWTDGTNTYLYFTYTHPEHEITIVPEFPTWTSILLILTVLTVAIAIYKRKLLKTPIH